MSTESVVLEISLQPNHDSMKNSFLFALVIFFACCGKENSDENVKTNDKGEIISLPYLWKFPLHQHEGNFIHNPPLFDNMVFDERVLIPTTNSADSRNLTMINSNDGSKLWDWSEWFQPETEGGNVRRKIVSGNYHHWINGTRRYTIDLETGESVLRDRNAEDISFSTRNTSIGSKTFLMSRIDNDEGFSTTALFCSDILNSHFELVLEVPYSSDTIGELNMVQGFDEVLPYINNGNEYLVVLSSQPYLNWNYDIRVNLYDWTDKNWIYTNKISVEPKQNNSGWSMLYNDHLYFSAGREILCYEIMTGKRVWQRDFPHDFTFSGFEISDGIMVANCENAVCYGINPTTGNIIWQSDGSGTASKLNNRIMDGVVYFKGGGPAFFFAKDINTGETLWRLDPYEFETSNAYWTESVSVIPGKDGDKGKVIVLFWHPCLLL